MAKARVLLSAVLTAGVMCMPICNVWSQDPKEEERYKPASDGIRQTTDIDHLLDRDPDVRTLLAVRDEITRRVIELHIPPDQLRRAYQAGDEYAIAELMGYSEAEIRAFRGRLDEARVAIFQKFPQVERMAQESPTPSYQTDDLFFLDHLRESEPNIVDRATCRIVPYVAALSLCTLAGPVFYWPCAYVALCSFCSGGWVGTICG